jgi:hypothetical protein
MGVWAIVREIEWMELFRDNSAIFRKPFLTLPPDM